MITLLLISFSLGFCSELAISYYRGNPGKLKEHVTKVGAKVASLFNGIKISK